MRSVVSNRLVAVFALLFASVLSAAQAGFTTTPTYTISVEQRSPGCGARQQQDR